MADVILIGNDDHNGLGLVRSFGLHGIKPYGIIIGENSRKGFLRYSKYWHKLWFIKHEEYLLDVLLSQHFSDKTVLIPYSDGAARFIDLNLNKLSKYYLCPSINKKQGEIAHLMNKLEQTKLAKQLNLQTISSQTLEIAHPVVSLSLPIIIKPLVSAEGNKQDIRICYTQQEMLDVIEEYRHKDYKNALVQTYLSQRTEYVLAGSILNEKFSFTLLSNIRVWPIERGTGCFSKFCLKEDVLRYARMIMQKLLELGYRGPIDIEFFQDDTGQFYLNEINWRSSGRNFVSLYNGVHSAYFYYCACTHTPLPIGESLINNQEGFSMNEATDLRHVIFRKLPLKTWINNWENTHSFALWYDKDLKPTLVRYFELFLKAFKK